MGRRLGEILLVPVVLVVIAFVWQWNLLSHNVAALIANGDPDLPPLLSEAQAGELIDAARGALMGESTGGDALPLEIIGAAVYAYNGDGPVRGAGCFGNDARAAVTCAAEQLRKRVRGFGLSSDDLVSVHLLRERRSATPLWWRDLGFGYSPGLYATLLVTDQSARLVTDSSMHVRALDLKRAFQLLSARRIGLDLKGDAGETGKFIVPTESYTEYQGKAVRLVRASTPLTQTDITRESVMDFCRLGGDYLVGILQPNNQWLYEGNLGFDKYASTYNLLRHAGTIYSLYELSLATGLDRYRQAGDRAWIWLMEQIRREKDDQGHWCAFPVETKRKGKKTRYQVKLGGTGLTLIALSEKLKIEKSPANLRLGRELANHILRSQKPDGSFHSYWPYKGTAAKGRRSIYYPGEAMLGLMRFYAHDPNPKYLDAVKLSAKYFINERFKILGMRLQVPPDAWLMIALNELHRVAPEPLYADYCATLVDSMINDQFDRPWEIKYPDYDGGYFPYPPQVTPAGARMEGITACYQTMDRAGMDTDHIAANIKRAARFQTERIIRPEFAHLYPNPRRALGAFRNSPVSNFIRIDYNQHNISGLLVTADILGSREN
ncbi:MAG: hypothetical protein P9L99_01295 [Candidatus Lernaella stagnicola]|nr:hypothetical protein [Candidatus Lernaella stagnicola]